MQVVNLHEFARRNLAAGMADTANLLERLRKDGRRHVPLTRICGLAFIENAPPADGLGRVTRFQRVARYNPAGEADVIALSPFQR